MTEPGTAMPPPAPNRVPRRRAFLARAAQGAAAAVCGGVVWGAFVARPAQAAAGALRPPGARDEPVLAATCVRCGLCVLACPYRTLRLAVDGDPAPRGTPYFAPRSVPCYMCPDIPCAKACPTGALDARLPDVARARMGLAVVDAEHCLSWQGLRCEVCHRDCPVTNKAITVVHHPRKTSKHAVFVPLVHSEHCTGCGICEKVCPTDVPAIRIVQADLVQGKMGAHYRLGWTIDTPITQEFVPAQEAGPVRPGVDTTGAGVDYLND